MANIDTTTMEKIEAAREAATEEVIMSTSCPYPAAISNGWCDVWAIAFKKKFPAAEIRQTHGHYYVVYRGVSFDSDGWFSPPA